MRKTKRWIALAGCVALAGTARDARAVDGVVEINGASALAGGVTPGDGPGFPVTISQPGSYRLTSDLTTGSGDVTLIEIIADSVTLDLNGFRLRCTGELCVPGTGRGVDSSSDDVVVRNGGVVGTGSFGLRLAGVDALVQDVRVLGTQATGIVLGPRGRALRVAVHGNGQTGIEAGSGSHLAYVTAQENGNNGIFIFEGSSVLHSLARSNGAAGIFVSGDGTLIGNMAFGNAGVGLLGGTGSTFHQNTGNENGTDGISCATSCTIVENTAYNNGSDGIAAGSASLVRGNTTVSNGTGAFGFGLNLSNSTGYRENLTSGNNQGNVDVGINMGGNVCGANLVCP